MPAPEDLYELLGVSPTASEAEIRRAYRKHAIFRHRQGAQRLAAKIQHMTSAYETLTDPDKRRAYDRLRELYVVEPRRRRNDLEAAAIRREGRLRRLFANQTARAASARGRAAVLENAPLIEALAAEHELAELRRMRALVRRRLLRGLATAVLLLLSVCVLLHLAQSYGR